jgi:hypothetical protein
MLLRLDSVALASRYVTGYLERNRGSPSISRRSEDPEPLLGELGCAHALRYVIQHHREDDPAQRETGFVANLSLNPRALLQSPPC